MEDEFLDGMQTLLQVASNQLSSKCHQMHSQARFGWYTLLNLCILLEDLVRFCTQDFADFEENKQSSHLDYLRLMHDISHATDQSMSLLDGIEKSDFCNDKRAKMYQRVLESVKATIAEKTFQEITLSVVAKMESSLKTFLGSPASEESVKEFMTQGSVTIDEIEKAIKNHTECLLVGSLLGLAPAALLACKLSTTISECQTPPRLKTTQMQTT